MSYGLNVEMHKQVNINNQYFQITCKLANQNFFTINNDVQKKIRLLYSPKTVPTGICTTLYCVSFELNQI